MKIYIAGKYTGLPHHEAVEKFAQSENTLIEMGIEPSNVVNPTKHVPEGTAWKESMDVCMPLLETCNAIFIQRDWHDSFGAKKEINRAMELHFDIFYEEMNDLTMLENLIQTGL